MTVCALALTLVSSEPPNSQYFNRGGRDEYNEVIVVIVVLVVVVRKILLVKTFSIWSTFRTKVSVGVSNKIILLLKTSAFSHRCMYVCVWTNHL